MSVAADRDFTFSAVFLDALGTLVEIEPPWEHLRSVIPEGVSDEKLLSAVMVEMEYYRQHADEGYDAESLADLRDRCAALLSDQLGAEITVAELLDSVRFRAYPDSAPALTELRERGLRLVVVSNWDCSLGWALESCGLAGLIDGAVASAVAGARKPDPAIFDEALELAGVTREQALHVGDTREEDVAGAEAAGIKALLIDRGGNGGDIASLGEIVKHL
jgi:putative hydrolase of the HAD superfamily